MRSGSNLRSTDAMIQIKYSNIPLWLHDSEFYYNLSGDEPNSIIAVPAACYRETSDSVTTVDDLADILNVMRFWGLKEIPQCVFVFCHKNDASIWNPVVVDIMGNGMPEHQAISAACLNPPLFLLEVALSTNRPELVTFWLSINKVGSVENKDSIAQACRYGRLDLVKTLLERGFKKDDIAYCAAAQYGHVHVLQYLYENGFQRNHSAIIFAARGGHVECIKFLRTMNCFWPDEITIEFAVEAHYKYLQSSGNLGYNLPWTDDWSIKPPVGGYLKFLQLALEVKSTVHKDAAGRAAKYGLLDCLQLLHLHNAPWDADTAAAAASGGHLECISYLRDNGCPFDFRAIESAAGVGHLHVLQLLDAFVVRDWYASATAAAAGGGHLHCLQFLHVHRYSWDASTAARAAFGGFVDCLHYLHIHGCEWGKEAPKGAALKGHLTCLQYLYENKCPWNNEAPAWAAWNNHINCLRYLHEHGCEWDESTVLNAAVNGHVECLRYAIENGCPFNELDTLKAAAGACTVECLQFLVEDRAVNVPTDGIVFRAALTKARYANMQFLVNKGFHPKSAAFI